MIFVIIFDRPYARVAFRLTKREHTAKLPSCRTGRIKINYENHFERFDYGIRLSGSCVFLQSRIMKAHPRLRPLKQCRLMTRPKCAVLSRRSCCFLRKYRRRPRPSTATTDCRRLTPRSSWCAPTWPPSTSECRWTSSPASRPSSDEPPSTSKSSPSTRSGPGRKTTLSYTVRPSHLI